MFKARVFSSARARFTATAATVFALVALGGVTAAPAYAYGNMTITISDVSTGGAYSDKGYTMTPLGGGFPFSGTTDAAGVQSVGTLEEGDYYVNPDDPSYVSENALITIGSGGNTPGLAFDKYRASGSVQAGAGDVGTTAVVERSDGGGGWIADTVTQYPFPGTDSFEVRVPSGPGTYRIKFIPTESSEYFTTYSPSFDVDGTVAVTAVGAVTLEAAGTITGNVVAYNLGAGLQGADVHAQVGGVDVSTATTDVNGDFRIKVPQTDASYTVWADHPTYEVQYHHYATQESYATPVTLDAGNGYTATGIDYLLNLDTSDLYVNVVDGNGAAHDVDFTLYPYDSNAGNWSSFPYYLSYEPSSTLDYNNLREGSYRLVLQQRETGVVLPVNGACFLEFTSVVVTNIDFIDAQVDTTADASTCDPAYLVPGDASVTGAVTNIDSLDYPVTAQLWSRGPYQQLYVVDSSPVDPDTGDYELQGLRDAWYYSIKFVTDDRDPYLDTILGSNGPVWASDRSVNDDVVNNFPLPLDPDDPTTLDDYDVALEAAVVLSGSVLDGTTPIAAADVQAIDWSDSNIRFVQDVDADGNYIFKLPIGGSYVLYAETDDDEYAAEYWDDVLDFGDATVIDATAPGDFGPFDFDLEPTAPQLYVWVEDEQNYDEVKVHLYFWQDDAWQELEEQDTVWQQAYFTQNFDTGTNDGLLPGDYRVRFESLSTPGLWLEATESAIGQDASDGSYTEYTTASCFVDFTGLTSGFASYVDATFDVLNQDPAACAAEPLPYSDVSATVLGSSVYGNEIVADHWVHLYNDDEEFTTSTDEDGKFEISDVPNGTYTLEILPTEHVLTKHEYSYLDTTLVLGGGISTLALTATRYGNAIGEISNWDPDTMEGAYATVYHQVIDPDGNYWVPAPVDSDVSDGGTFEAPGIDASGEYAVLITFPDTWAPVFIGGGDLEPDDSFTGVAQEDYTFVAASELDLVEYVQISGTAFFNGIPAEGTLVFATPVGSCGCALFAGSVDENGDYSIDVYPGYSYEVAAINGVTLTQAYDSLDFAADFTGPYNSTPVVVGTTDVPDINFVLNASDDVRFDLDLASWDSTDGSYDDFDDVTAHLYQKDGQGWVEVDTDLSNPAAYLEAQGDGDYRLRFEKNGDWLAVTEMDSYVYYPFADLAGGYDELDPAQCYYDFESLQHGTYVIADVALALDSSDYACGAETVVNHEVVGSTVRLGNPAGGGIEGQTVTLTNDATGFVYTETTGPGGSFTFPAVAAGSYVFEAPSMVTTGGDRFVGYGVAVAVDADEDLGPIELTRYGNVEVQITNFNAAMAGTTAQVYQLVGTVWEPRGYGSVVNTTGFVVLPGVASDGTYTVYLDYPAGFVDGYLTSYDEGVVQTAPGQAEQDITGLGTLAYTTISGTVTLGATWVTGASIVAENQGTKKFTATSDANGAYTVAVPAGDVYSVEATKTGLLRALETNLSVAYAPVTNLGLDMLYAFFEFDVYAASATSGPVTAHLYRQVAGGWQEVATDTASTVHLWTTLSGSYRLRFSDGADWLAVTAYDWSNSNGSDLVALTFPDPDVCFIDIAPALGGGDYWGEAVVDPTSAVECAAEPAVVAPPVTPGTSGSGTGGSGTKKPAASTTPAATTTTEEEVVPTSTPTPTAEPTDTATEEPSETTEAEDCCAPDSAPDFTWAFWAAGIIALLVLAGGAVYFVRRRP